ncbi:MAG: discoidin domain-containing protein [Lachnospiraceae bacterium]|nr:discoidin domain-containing protein [Lachnospiraceae bacterium]
MKGLKTIKKRVLSAILAAALVMTGVSVPGAKMEAQAAFAGGMLSTATSATAENNVVMVDFDGGTIKGKITFLDDGVFRYNVDPSNEFSAYAKKNNATDTAKIPQYPDDSEAYTHPEATVSTTDSEIVITSGKTEIKFEKATAKMSVVYDGNVVMQESQALLFKDGKSTQTLVKNSEENFFGGGTQNGRFVHTGEIINIQNNGWVDGGVASPSPFYYTSQGYGILRNTFFTGSYDFGKTQDGVVTTVHNENEYDAYYFLSDGKEDKGEVVQDILQGYFHVTGNPVLLPEYGFYEGHLNCYNRDSWSDDGDDTTGWVIKGSASATNTAADDEKIASAYRESGGSGYIIPENVVVETLNGELQGVQNDKFPAGTTTDYKYSARAVIDQYEDYDMPLGYFLPNDGYGCGYGLNGYQKTGGVGTAEREAAINANIENLADLTEYAEDKGVATGLWTQSNLTPDNTGNTAWHLLRDFEKEVNQGGITTLKTDVAWVGSGSNFALNGVKFAYDTITEDRSFRPNIITLCGWAGTQRYGSIWTGDQTGGNWEYIRFHIPTFIGQSLAGNPNIGSDMDGIFGGSAIISTRDTQWKTFAPQMLNMDGWGSFAKTPQTFGDPYTGIHRMYLKLKAQLMAYIYTSAASASNIDTGNGDTGLPMIRAMFLEFPTDSYAASKDMQYQYMFGNNFLVAPIYQETNMDVSGNDIRNDIYLPDSNEIWIDYFTGKQYQGGQVINGFEAPIWKLPLFVRNGSIVPMWEENNSPTSINKENRIVEFWPEGTTEYTLYEDDGTTAKSEIETVEGYGTVNKINYGGNVLTKFTSVVNDGTATLIAAKSTGNYEGYNKDKKTTFVVNVSKEPQDVIATNGSTVLEKVVVGSKTEFDGAEVAEGKFIYYYDESPAIETYVLPVEDEFIDIMKDETSTPKLYVKFATTDSQANEQKLVINGFENKDAGVGKNELNSNLQVPANLTDKTEAKTPTSNTLTWSPVEGATVYELEIDGVIHSAGAATEFVHDDQPYNSKHTYKVRAKNADGYSAWSDAIEATTDLDPWRDVPAVKKISWDGKEYDLSVEKDVKDFDHYGSSTVDKMFDHIVSGDNYHSKSNMVTNAEENPIILDYGYAYKLDKLEYYPREDIGKDYMGNGTIYRMDIYTSLDGYHWTIRHDGTASPWAYTNGATAVENKKTVSLKGVTARYVKLVLKQSAGNFFTATELALYKEEGSKAFAVGSTLGNMILQDGDYTNMKNYLGLSTKDADWGQVSGADLNGNGYYDVYDYAFTMFNMNGGTLKTGKVSGDIFFIPSKTEVQAGETFTVDVYANNVENLNAFGEVIKYKKDKVTFESVSQSLVNIGQMENLTMGKVHEDEAFIDLAFANNGNQETFSGSGILATITMKAVEAGKVSEAMELGKITLIGPKFDFKVSNSLATPILPELNDGVGGEYRYGTDFNLTMTNDVLTEDPSSRDAQNQPIYNVTKLIQSNTYDKLFDKQVNRDDFQFKLNTETNYEKVYPDYITLPTTLTFALKGDKKVETVKVYNANYANGYVTKANVVFTYDGGSKSDPVEQEVTNRTDYTVLTFDNPSPENKVISVDVIVTEAVTGSGTVVNHMLTLTEIQIFGSVITGTGGEEVPEEPNTEGTNPAAEEGEGSGEEAETVSANNFKYQDDFTVTMTNPKREQDNGNNVVELTQGGSYDRLFNGDLTNRDDFQFKWDTPGNYVSTGKLPGYVKLPTTMHVNMTEANEIATVSIQNGALGNGYVTSAKAKFNYEGGSASEEITQTIAEKVADHKFEFVNPSQELKVTSVEVTILEADKDGDAFALSIAEMQVTYPGTTVPVTAIAIAENQVKQLYKGETTDIKVVFTPENASNPYYTVSSNDISKVRVVTLTDDQGLPVYKLYGDQSGTATITVTALESADSENPITATFEVTVLEGANKTKLIDAIQKYSSLNRKFYTEESFANLEEKLAAANTVKEDVAADDAAVKTALDNLNLAFNLLEESPVTLIADITGFKVEAPHSDSNLPEKVLDYQEGTFWESPYGGNEFFLPKELKFTLDGTYNLDKIEVVKNSAANGKLLKFEVLVSKDGVDYYSVGTKETPATESNPYIRLDEQGITHVIVRLLQACQGEQQVQYVRVSDVKFYGVKQGAGEEPGQDPSVDPELDYGDITEEDRVDLTSIPGKIWLKGLTDKAYTGSKVTQKFRVYDGNVMLKEGVDYTVSYKNNVNASTGASATFDKNKPTVTIKMKGNYKGSQSINFNILPQSLNVEAVTVDAVTKTISAKEPTPVVYWNGKALKAKKDFTVTYNYGDNGSAGQAGTYSITIKGINNFTDEKVGVSYTVSNTAVSLAKATVAIDKAYKSVVWDGNGATIPADKITVKVGKNVVDPSFYVVKYANNKVVGTAYLIVEANPEANNEQVSYTGSKRATFKVTGTAMKAVEVVGMPNPAQFPYEGKAIEPIGMADVKVKLGDKELVAGTDFTVTYKNNAKQGKATMTLTGNAAAGFTGTKSVPFTIGKGQLDASMLKFVGTTEVTAATQEITVPFTQGGTKPAVKVMANGKELVLGTDYTVAYSNNKKVDQMATIKITGKGNYAGTITKDFKIVKKNASSGEISVVVADKVENLKAKTNGWKATFKVVDISGKALTANKDYVKEAKYTVISSKDNAYEAGYVIQPGDKIPAGTKINVEVTLAGDNFEGTVSGEYTILGANYDISKAKFTISGKDYTGKPVTLTDDDIKIAIKKLNKDDLVLGQDYVIVEPSYTNNVKKGTAKVTLKGIGDFGGTKTVTFKIGQRDIAKNLFEDLFNWIFG